MNELAIKLSELLEVSVDSAIKMYPELRGQFVAYEIISSIRGMFILFSIILFLVVVVLACIYFVMLFESCSLTEEEEIFFKKSKKALIVTVSLFSLLLIAIAILKVASIYVAPDLNMMLKFI